MNNKENFLGIFQELCERSNPESFLAITVDYDSETNFACSGITVDDAIELLELMAEHLKLEGKRKQRNE